MKKKQNDKIQTDNLNMVFARTYSTWLLSHSTENYKSERQFQINGRFFNKLKKDKT